MPLWKLKRLPSVRAQRKTWRRLSNEVYNFKFRLSAALDAKIAEFEALLQAAEWQSPKVRRIVALAFGAPNFDSTIKAHYSSYEIKERNAVSHGVVGIIVAYAWSHDGKKIAITRARFNDTDVVMFSGFR